MSGRSITLRIREVATPADQIVELVLESMGGLDLPAWTPGAHIEVVLPSGLVRHYSLCGDLGDPKTYRICVLREAAGRGGSAEMHDYAAAGKPLPVRAPRNSFPLDPAPAYLFLAGGIGITPILPMIQAAERDGIPWRLVYGGRTRASMAYLDELIARHGERIEVYADDVEGRPDFEGLLGAAAPGTLVYACGPAPMLDRLSALVDDNDWPIELRLERFSVDAVDTRGEPFEVELARSGTSLHIGREETILGAMRAAGLTAPFSCENGYCGSCEAVVLEGEPEHRDTYLTETEKEESFTMMICVSRCAGERLVLDL